MTFDFDLNTFTTISSFLVGASSVGAVIVTKLMTTAKMNAIIEHRLDNVENEISELKKDNVRVEEKLTSQLLRLEDKIDKILLKK